MQLKDISDSTLHQDIHNASAPLLWALALALKARRHIEISLDIIEILLAHQESFVYARYGDIMLLKAVLLSDDTYKRWDEAIHILRILDEAIGYSRRNIEVITLLGSNYKRKALYDTTGSLKRGIDANDQKALTNALGYYYDALRLRPQNERYYDLVNIFYLEKMLAHANSGDLSKVESGLKNRLPAYLSDVKTCGWWEFVSFCELYILAGYDTPADWLNKRTQLPTCDEYHITKRQMDIYRHFCLNDGLFNDFYAAYIDKYEATCA